MNLSPLGVRAASGSLRVGAGIALEHTWTEAGVLVGPVTNGAQALHLAVALCVLNDVWREAAARGIEIHGVVVEADGGFDEEWRSTGISYAVTIASDGPPSSLEALLDAVDDLAEIPRALRAGAGVRRVEAS